MPRRFDVRHWQIGNETSYDKNGFDLETAARKTVEFAKAMRSSDPGIELIAWGDSRLGRADGRCGGRARPVLAFHHMFDPDSRTQPVLRGETYRRDPDAAWAQLMTAWQRQTPRFARCARASAPGRFRWR